MNKLNEMTESELAALALDLADKNGPVAMAIALLEYAAELFRDKGKGKSADGYLRLTQELREKIDLPRPSIVGIDRLLGRSSATSAEENGYVLKAAIERLARQVIQRELKPGGLIQHFVQENTRHA